VLVDRRRSADPRSKLVAPIRPVGTGCSTLWCCMAHPSPSEQAYCPNITNVLCHQSHPYLWYLSRCYPSRLALNRGVMNIPVRLVGLDDPKPGTPGAC
jgi:hypothetical protein